MKITQADYYLPTITALNLVRNLGSGATKPLLVTGICTTKHEKIECVLKCINSPRMSAQASCRELIASYVAMELGLNVPQPLIIDITEIFVETLIGNSCFEHASNSVGKNFGCEYQEGHWEYTSNQAINANLAEAIRSIFAFDLLIANPDRRVDKPNLLTNGDNILIFDHELAFSFVFLLFQNPEPWKITEDDLAWVKNHYFYSRLKGQINDFSTFVDKLTSLDMNFWERVESAIPPEWQEEGKGQLNKIRNTINLFVDHKDEFKQELNRILL